MTAMNLDYKSLSIPERIQLVGEIWDSIAEETPVPNLLSLEESAELHRRLVDHVTDLSTGIPWETVRANFSRFHHRRKPGSWRNNLDH